MSDIEKVLAGMLLCVGTVSSVCDTRPCSTSGRQPALQPTLFISLTQLTVLTII
jgi:hypothetical protein